MLLCHYGTPSELTIATLKVLQAVAKVAFGDYNFIHANTEDDLQKGWGGRTHTATLIVGDIPEAAVVDFIIKSGSKLLLTLDDPLGTLASIKRRRDIHGLDAIRFACQSFATLHDFAISPSALVVPSSARNAPLASVVTEVSRLYGLSADDKLVASILADLVPADRGPDLKLGDLFLDTEMGQNLDADADLGMACLKPFDSLQRKISPQSFVWPPNVFLGADPHGAPLSGPQNLMGGRRCFLFGPYLHLPRGKWRATINFAIRDNLSGNLLRAEIFTDRVIWDGHTRLPAQGDFSFDIDFEISEARLPLQIRLFNWEGAIEGILELAPVHLRRLS